MNLKQHISSQLDGGDGFISGIEGNGNLPIINENEQKEAISVNLSLGQDQRMELSSVPQVAVSLDEAKERVAQLQNFIKHMMVPNVDYGIIPGSQKPTLFKPGAEKLADIYGLSKKVEVVNRIEDFDNGFFHYEVKATLINKKTGIVEAEGLGSCNTKEKKFQKHDPFSIVNSVLKMSKKRAVIDAVLSATRTSGIFSQDMDSKGA